jgi:hypothetical protein
MAWLLAGACVLVQVAGNAAAQQDEGPILRPKKPPAKPAAATLLAMCDLACNWKLDGEAKGHIDAGGSAKAKVEFGQHVLVAVTDDGLDKTQKDIEIKTVGQTVVRIELQLVKAARLKAEQNTDLKPPERLPINAFTGAYSGVVQNLTGGVSSDFTVSLRENKDGVIEGCMAVKPPLGGSGYLKGQVEGSQFSFNVVGALSQISFKGQREANDLSGTYLVSFPEGQKQNGKFSLHRTSLDVPSSEFSSTTCPDDAAILIPAAEQGDAPAQAYLGTMYYLGRGVPQDYSKARTLLKKACDGGEQNACDMMRKLF